MPVWALFKGITTGEVRWWYRPPMVYGVPLRVCAVRDAHGHVLYVATLKHGQHALEAYSRRWSIEEGFWTTTAASSRWSRPGSEMLLVWNG